MASPFGMTVRLSLALLVFVSGSPRVAAVDDEPTFRHEPLKKLLLDLKDKDVMVRRMAATTLGMPDGTQGKGGPRVRGDLWPAILALVDALKDADNQVRTNSVKSISLLMRYRGIAEKADPRAETTALAVIAALKDSDDMVRSAAAASLATVPVDTKPGVKALGEVMKHEESRIRAAAAEGARGVQPMSEIVPALADALGDKEAPVRLAAANSLAYARHLAVGAVKPLALALKDTDAKVVAAAAMALGAVGPQAKPAVPALAEVVTDRQSPNRGAAVSALGMIHEDPEVSVPTLIGALSVVDTRQAATYALSAFGKQATMAAPMLLSVGRDEKGSVRPEMIEALYAIDPEGSARFELLFAALRDANPYVRGAAVDHCARDGSVPAALPVLVELFKVDGNLRNRIGYAFGAMGAEAKPIVPMLVEMIRDPETNQQLRRILTNSLRAIDPDALKIPGM